MAFISIKYCTVCKRETPHTGDSCDVCRDKRIQEEEERWNNMSMSEKLEYLNYRLKKYEKR